MTQLLSSPSPGAHLYLMAEGSTGRCTSLAQLAAHLSGYMVFKINPSALVGFPDYSLDSFKADLVKAYTKAGVKVSPVQKILFTVDLQNIQHELKCWEFFHKDQPVGC